MSANTNGASSLRRDGSGWLADLVTALRDREILTAELSDTRQHPQGLRL